MDGLSGEAKATIWKSPGRSCLREQLRGGASCALGKAGEKGRGGWPLPGPAKGTSEALLRTSRTKPHKEEKLLGLDSKPSRPEKTETKDQKKIFLISQADYPKNNRSIPKIHVCKMEEKTNKNFGASGKKTQVTYKTNKLNWSSRTMFCAR